MTEVKAEPESTALRVALWRALHVLADAKPHVLEDELGLRLAVPAEGWRQRPDMDPQGTRGFRASIVGRARLIEDLVAEQAAQGVRQYVLLGAGLDTFAQRRRDLAEGLAIFEVDQPGPQAWKRQRLVELGFGVPAWLHLVPVNFEAGGSWLAEVEKAGFKRDQPAVIASTGVSMYLSREASLATLKQIAGLAAGTTLAMTYLLPPQLLQGEEKAVMEMTLQRAQASGTPFVSLYKPEEMLSLATQAGFKQAQCISGAEVTRRYFAGRADGLNPGHAEEMLIAKIE